MDKFFDIHVPLVFNPELLGGSRSDGKGWWIVGQAESSLGKYLRKLYAMSNYYTSLLMRPAWADHLTIVRDEFPTISKDEVGFFWDKYRNQTLQFRILLTPQTNGLYWWMPAISEGAMVLRAKLGLCREPEVPFHLTFGHTRLET